MLVIGDAMIDAYMWGTINRQSPEAPIPIVDISQKEKRLGGAANVAINLQALGVTPLLCSVVGTDKPLFFELMNKHGLDTRGLLTEQRKTSTKTRIIAENKHQLRVDDDDVDPIEKESEFIENTRVSRMRCRYFSGLQQRSTHLQGYQTLISHAKQLNKFILVDPKKTNFWLYKGRIYSNLI